jgi:hypothetical protein
LSDNQLVLCGITPVSKDYACFARPYFKSIDKSSYFKINGTEGSYRIENIESIDDDSVIKIEEMLIQFNSDERIFCYYIPNEEVFCGYKPDLFKYLSNKIDKLIINKASINTLFKLFGSTDIEKIMTEEFRKKEAENERLRNNLNIAKDRLARIKKINEKYLNQIHSLQHKLLMLEAKAKSAHKRGSENTVHKIHAHYNEIAKPKRLFVVDQTEGFTIAASANKSANDGESRSIKKRFANYLHKKR